ncbi:MAG: S-layer homology domain-containing protein [Oscillospiraceae bacterium]|nr:S-layer homology domain-containing protein [Oscillospiraceae bacterium]
MKKIITAILAANLILCTFASVSYADTAVSDSSETVSVDETAKILADVKSKFVIPDTLTEFKSSKHLDDDITVYSFSWNNKEYNNSIDIAVNDKGDIVRYYSYFNEEDSYGEYNSRFVLSAMSDDEVKNKAKEWLVKAGVSYINEIDFDNAQISSSIYDQYISINAGRIVNGIKFPENNIWLRIKKTTGEIDDFYCNWEYKELPSANGIISSDEAKSKYRQANALELVYALDDYDSKKAGLKYLIGDKVINAATGEVEIDDARRYYGFKTEDAAASGANMKEMGAELNLSPEEISEIEKLTKLISTDEADKIIFSVENTEFDEYGVNAYNYFKNDDEYITEVALESFDGKKYATATINAVSGEVLSFYTYQDYRYDPDNKLPEAEIKSIADKIVDKLNSNKSEYKYVQCTDNTAEYVRLVNGIPYYNDAVTVRISPETKKVFGYHKSYSRNIEFENKNGLLSEDEAYEKFYQNVGFEPQYKNIYTEKRNDYETKLVYMSAGDCSYIDARSGEAEYPYEKKIVYPTDISGHYAEEAIKALIGNEVIINESDKFEPDATLTQKEALAMFGPLGGIYSVKDTDSDDFYKSIIRRGIISSAEKNPEEKVTREKAVKYILHAIGYTNIKYIDESVFASGFNDEASISPEYNRYVAAAKGLKIVRGDENGNFNPQEQVTKGQFAVMLYNALARNV